MSYLIYPLITQNKYNYYLYFTARKPKHREIKKWVWGHRVIRVIGGRVESQTQVYLIPTCF